MILVWNNKIFPRKTTFNLFKRVVGIKHKEQRPDEILFTISEVHELFVSSKNDGYLKHLEGALKCPT